MGEGGWVDGKAEYEERFDDVLSAVASACTRAGRGSQEIRVIGVTKTVDKQAIDPLLDVGVREFGENRWQHAREMLMHPRRSEATWHFIGHLQTNKAKYIVPNFDYIHSIDSLPLLEEIERQAERFERQLYGLIQVNVSGEETKYGLKPHDARALLERAAQCKRLQVVGLMTMAPAGVSDEEARAVFRGLSSLRFELSEQLGLESLTELSMGMSDDFPLAIEEGATMIRVGRRLMGDTFAPAG